MLLLIEVYFLLSCLNFFSTHYIWNPNDLLISLDFPGYVTNPRGLGLWAAFDLPSGTERDELWHKLMENNLLILVSGDKSIRFRPHLNVTPEDIDESIEIISAAVKEMLR